MGQDEGKSDGSMHSLRVLKFDLASTPSKLAIRNTSGRPDTQFLIGFKWKYIGEPWFSGQISVPQFLIAMFLIAKGGGV